VAAGSFIALDQPWNVEWIANHTGGADHAARAVRPAGKIAQPCIGPLQLETAQQQVECLFCTRTALPGDLGQGIERLGSAHTRSSPDRPEAAFRVVVPEAGGELSHQVCAAELSCRAVSAGADQRVGVTRCPFEHGFAHAPTRTAGRYPEPPRPRPRYLQQPVDGARRMRLIDPSDGRNQPAPGVVSGLVGFAFAPPRRLIGALEELLEIGGVATLDRQDTGSEERTGFAVFERLLRQYPGVRPSDAQSIDMRLDPFVEANEID